MIIFVFAHSEIALFHPREIVSFRQARVKYDSPSSSLNMYSGVTQIKTRDQLPSPFAILSSHDMKPSSNPYSTANTIAANPTLKEAIGYTDVCNYNSKGGRKRERTVDDASDAGDRR